MLITHQHFSYRWTALAQDWGRLCFWLCPQVSRLGVGKMLAGTTDHRDLSCHLMVCSTIKLGENFFLKLLLLKHWLVTSLLVVSDCLCIIWGAFSFFPLHLLNCLYLHAWVFSLLPSDSLPHPIGQGEGRARSCVVLSCLSALTQLTISHPQVG